LYSEVLEIRKLKIKSAFRIPKSALSLSPRRPVPLSNALKSDVPIKPPVLLSVAMKIDYPGNIVPRPLINMKSPTSQTPNAPYSAFRNPKSALLFIGFFPYFFPDKKVPKNHGCAKKAKTRRAFWREESRLLQLSSSENRCTKVTRTLPAIIAYDSSLY